MTHCLFWCTFQCSTWERCFIAYFLEERHNTRCSLFHVVLTSSIERIDKCISIWMNIQHKFDFILMVLKKISECLSLRLRKWFWTRIKCWTRVISISISFILHYKHFIFNAFFIFFAKINSKVPIEINSNIIIVSINFDAALSICSIHIFSMINKFFLFKPIFFDVCHTINIENRHKIVFILLKKLLEFRIFFNSSLLNKLEHFKNI